MSSLLNLLWVHESRKACVKPLRVRRLPKCADNDMMFEEKHCEFHSTPHDFSSHLLGVLAFDVLHQLVPRCADVKQRFAKYAFAFLRDGQDVNSAAAT